MYCTFLSKTTVQHIVHCSTHSTAHFTLQRHQSALPITSGTSLASLQCTAYNNVHCTEHYTVYCTVNYIVYCTVHCIVQYTAYTQFKVADETCFCSKEK